MGATIVTGGYGFLGSQLVRLLNLAGVHPLIPLSRANGDLRDPRSTRKLFHRIYELHGGIDTVYHLAATVSGIGGISQFPASYFYDNLMIGMNVIDVCAGLGPLKLIVAGSVCALPERCPVPMLEEHLWDGAPEKTNLPYGVAKRVLSTALQAYHQQHKLDCGYLLLANLYGPGDNYEPATSHVIPALIRKFQEAIDSKADAVEIWGTGTASRDFLYVEDAAKAFVAAGKCLSSAEIVNVGSGEEWTIASIAKLIGDEMGFQGTLVFDPTKPDGQKRRMLRIWKAETLLKWKPETSLKYGLQKTILDYQQKRARR